MNKDEVFTTIVAQLTEIVPEVDRQSITTEHSLQELGANSLDRFEILSRTIAHYELKKQLTDFLECNNINDIITVMMTNNG